MLINTPALLAVSFGTSYEHTRSKTIDQVERQLQQANPTYEVRRAFTSPTIMRIMQKRDGIHVDSVPQALEHLLVDGVRDVLIQPTHMMPGIEYDEVVAQARAYTARFDSVKIGPALLTEDADYDRLIGIMTAETESCRQPGTAIVWMGHGTEHKSNAVYTILQEKLRQAGFSDHFIGTVEASPTVQDIIQAIRQSGADKVVLLPLMLVAGDHANHDMAGDDPHSWRSQFREAGIEAKCILRGLGEYPAIRQMIVDHAAQAVLLK